MPRDVGPLVHRSKAPRAAQSSSLIYRRGHRVAQNASHPKPVANLASLFVCPLLRFGTLVLIHFFPVALCVATFELPTT